MHTKTIALWMGLVVSLLPCTLAAQTKIPWLNDIHEARRIAQQQGKPILVHFWNEDCGPCRRLEGTVFNQPQVIRAISNSYVPVKINTHQQPEVARFYKIERIPTDLVLTASGVELHRGISKMDMTSFTQVMTQVASKALGTTPNGIAQQANGVYQQASDTYQQANNTYQQAGDTYRQAGNVFDQAKAGVAHLQQQSAGDLVQTGLNGLTPASNSNPSQGVAPNVGPQTGTSSMPPVPSKQGQVVYNPYANQSPSPTATSQYAQPYASTAGGNGSTSTNPDSAWGGNTNLQPNQVAGGDWNPNSSPTEALKTSNQFESTSPNSTLPPSQSQNTGTAPQQQVAMQAPVSPPNITTPNVASPNVTTPNVQTNPVQPPNHPPVALDGFCPVTLVSRETWQKADPKFGAVHRQRLYLFAGQEEQKAFMQDPDKYSPALSGYDPVHFVESRRLVEGNRQHGVFFNNAIYLFSTEQSLDQFSKSPERYVTIVRQAMSGQPASTRH